MGNPGKIISNDRASGNRNSPGKMPFQSHASFLRQRFSSACCKNTNLLVPSLMHTGIRGCCLVFRGKQTRSLPQCGCALGEQKAEQKNPLHVEFAHLLTAMSSQVLFRDTQFACQLSPVSSEWQMELTPDKQSWYFLLLLDLSSHKRIKTWHASCLGDTEGSGSGSAARVRKVMCGAKWWSLGCTILFNLQFCCGISRLWQKGVQRELIFILTVQTLGKPPRGGGVN